MANYNIVSSSYLILNDQTGSALTTSGQVSGSKYYTLIAPTYPTNSTLTLNLTSFTNGVGDVLRIYNDIPSKYTASFVYTGSVVSGQLIGVISGSPSLPQTFTPSSGKAYIAWAPASTTSSFTLQWTGSGFYTPDLTSSVSNRYSAVFPKTNMAAGSYMTFAVGRFTGSALTTNADIIFGTWLKPDTFAQSPFSEVYGIFSLGVNGDATHGPGITFYKPSNSNDLLIRAVDSANSTVGTLTMSGAMDGGGGAQATQYIPQWHHYGFVIKRTGTFMSLRAYKDGQIFTSGAVSGLTAGGNFATTYDHVVGNFRGGTGVLTQTNNFSGSIDDMFLITLATGSADTDFNNFFTTIYNSGSWKDPTLATGSLSASLNPKVQFAWRFEETGSILNTKDYGSFGNIHSASSQVIGAGAINLTNTVSGYSYTPYQSLSYAVLPLSNATVAFTQQTASVYENTASYIFGIQAVTAAVGQSATASIRLGDSNTATIGTDYNIIYAGTTYSSSLQFPFNVSWAANDTSIKYITASIIDNTVYTNSSSSFSVTFNTGGLVNVTTGSPNFFKLNILDYEEGNPSFTSTSYSVGETTSSVNFYIQRLSGSSGPLRVYCSTVNGTALSGTNYIAVSGTFSWSDGDTSVKTGSVTILNDNVYTRPDLYFNLNLSNLSTGSFLPYAVTGSKITINDQSAGTFNWSITSLSAYETGTLATVSITRTSGNYGDATVNITGSSSLGQPIRSTMSGTVTFSSGDSSSKQFTINIQDDLIDERDDIIYYTLYPTSSVSGNIAYTGSQGTLAFTLIDNETGSISFSTGSANVYENTSSYIINVQRLYGGDQAETASISYSSTLVEGRGYNVIYNGITQASPITISWADQDKSTKYITASIYDNQVSNSSNTINFSIASSSISSIGPTSSFVLTVLDYEEGIPSFTSASYSTGEASSSIRVYVNRTSGTNGPLSINYSTLDNTAKSGTNYTTTNGTLSWTDGDSSQKSFSIPILYDGVQTSNLNFTANLSNLSTGSFNSYPLAITSSTITITDQEPGTFKLDSSSYIVTESNSFSVTVTRYSGTFNNATVTVTSSNGTAVSGTDYTAVNQLLSFTDGQLSQSFNVSTIQNNTNVSGSLYFNLGISSVATSYGTGFKGTPSTATVTIIDNETGSVKFTSASYTGSQNSTIPIYIQRYIDLGGAPDFAATATVYVSASSTAVADVDYTNIFPYNVTWADQVSGTVTVNISSLGGSWSGDKILNLYLSGLTNVGTGSIMSASILIKSNVIAQSAQPSSSVSSDYTINDYINASNQFTRRTQQVPFSEGSNPFVRLQQAYSASIQ